MSKWEKYLVYNVFCYDNYQKQSGKIRTYQGIFYILQCENQDFMKKWLSKLLDKSLDKP